MAPLIFFLCILGVAMSQSCPGYEDHPLVVVSLDGFRAEYLSRGLTPNIQSLRDKGVSPPYMKASYPTVTFPNHYTIATGLYPESHGIVDNSFYDPVFNDSFNIGSAQSLQGRWWGGEPIWNTVVKQGKMSATYFWPGSDADIEGMHPTYYYLYNGSVPYEDRINQVLAWLALPVSERPSWICVYFDEPDHTGHFSGPNSAEMSVELGVVDQIIGQLISGIADLNLTDCVNLILLSDHGMTPSDFDHLVYLTDFVPNLDGMAVTYEGAFVRVDVDDQYEDETANIRENFTCQQPELRQFSPQGIPTRLHYSNNIRIGDIVVDLNPGYRGITGGTFYLDGEHGYDNYWTDMQPIFMAAGPDFLSAGATVEPFQNIELYNLMCHLVGVSPAPNNGTESSQYHLLVAPPSYPSITPENPPPVPVFPSPGELFDQQHLSGCLGDDNAPVNLNFTSIEQAALLALHLPWGTPQSGALPADLLLLHQQDHITGFSQTLKMPLWTSYVINPGSVNTLTSNWSSDVRLTTASSPTCSEYDVIASLNFAMKPLFPYRFGSSSPDVNFIVSNSVPMDLNLTLHWDYLVENLLDKWLANFGGPLNVVAGPVFDLNADSLVDNFTSFVSSPTPPSDLYLIVTRCQSPVSAINNCASNDLDSLSFIYPETVMIPNCMTMDQYALEFSSKIKDIEIATGLTFFPDLPYEDRTRLAIRIHSSLW